MNKIRSLHLTVAFFLSSMYFLNIMLYSLISDNVFIFGLIMQFVMGCAVGYLNFPIVSSIIPLIMGVCGLCAIYRDDALWMHLVMIASAIGLFLLGDFIGNAIEAKKEKRKKLS